MINKIIYIICLCMISSVVMAAPLPKDKSGGWVFVDGKFRIPTPQSIKYQIQGDLGINSTFNNTKMLALIKKAMRVWSQIANVRFIQMKSAGIIITKFSGMGTSLMATCFKPVVTCPIQYRSTGALLINSDSNYIITEINAILTEGYKKTNTPSNQEVILLHSLTHELGHLLGLDHNLKKRLPKTINILKANQLDTKLSSIMFSSIFEYHSLGGKWTYIESPSKADRNAVINMYGISPVYTTYLANNTAKATALKNEL